eukprot:5099074-Alexandrium_andersonii.AAC.1
MSGAKGGNDGAGAIVVAGGIKRGVAATMSSSQLLCYGWARRRFLRLVRRGLSMFRALLAAAAGRRRA